MTAIGLKLEKVKRFIFTFVQIGSCENCFKIYWIHINII